MDDKEFETAVSSLRDIPFREDFEAALYELYKASSTKQRTDLRARYRSDNLNGSKTWRNPADYDRSDLTREQKMRQVLICMSIQDGGRDYRDDLRSIAYCYHNLALLGVDADAVVEELAGMSGPRFAELVFGFVRRAPAEKSAAKFGLKIEQTPSGPVAECSP